MRTLREFLQNDPLVIADAKREQQDGQEFFREFISPSIDPLWLRLLSNFTHDAPLRYWDKKVIKTALDILNGDKQRTILALAQWKNQIGIGFDNLFRRASIEKYEENLSTTKTQDLILLANEFQPEYLRRCEHIFTNLIVLYWAILKKKSVEGSFDIASALSLLSAKHYQLLLEGYDDKVRNGIAHGQVVFGWDEINYGDIKHPHKMQADDFLYLFDTLFRTSNSLAIALLLFLANNQNLLHHAKNVVPVRIIILIASAGVERRDFTILGAIESELAAGTMQLHISMQTGFINRTSVMLDCARAALHLLDAGATGYSRYVFDIQQNDGVDSLLFIKPDKLALLQHEPYTRFSEILDSPPLLWKDEHYYLNLLKVLRLSFITNWQLHWKKFIGDLQQKGLFLGRNRFYIKRVENASASGLARVHIYVTLKFSWDADNNKMIKAIAEEVIRKFEKQRFPTNKSGLGKRYNWKKYPTYIWISLYQFEGTTRWATSRGWPGKNLIAAVEKHEKSKPPIFVKKVDEIWKGLRFQYSMDSKVLS